MVLGNFSLAETKLGQNFVSMLAQARGGATDSAGGFGELNGDANIFDPTRRWVFQLGHHLARLDVRVGINSRYIIKRASRDSGRIQPG
jgi:hypothetical protein